MRRIYHSVWIISKNSQVVIYNTYVHTNKQFNVKLRVFQISFVNVNSHVKEERFAELQQHERSLSEWFKLICSIQFLSQNKTRRGTRYKMERKTDNYLNKKNIYLPFCRTGMLTRTVLLPGGLCACVSLGPCICCYRCVRLSRDSLPPNWDTKPTPQTACTDPSSREKKKLSWSGWKAEENRHTGGGKRHRQPLTVPAWTWYPELELSFLFFFNLLLFHFNTPPVSLWLN